MLFISGCAIITANIYDDNVTFPSTDFKTVKVFQEPPTIREFIKIAEVTVDNVNTWSAVEKHLKIKGAELGGDAVYIINTMGSSRGAISGGQYGMAGGMTNIMTVTGVVIKYKE